jgi:hypothetical protein
VLDHAWRRCDAVIRDATLLVSEHQACNADQALSRLVFVAKHTNRRVQDIAADVVAPVATAQGAPGGVESRPYRFTL